MFCSDVRERDVNFGNLQEAGIHIKYLSSVLVEKKLVAKGSGTHTLGRPIWLRASIF